MLAAAGSDDGDLDLGKSFVKAAFDENVADFGKAVKDRLSLQLCRLDGPIPFILPRCPNISR